jgi:tetratricopeptide (TPR) repeat protein
MNRLGGLLREAGRDAEAEPCWRKAAEAGAPDAAYNLAILVAEAGRTSEAIRLLTQAAQTGLAIAMVDLAKLLAAYGRTGEAEQWRAKAKRLDPAETGQLNVHRNG